MTPPWGAGAFPPSVTRAGRLDGRTFYGRDIELVERMVCCNYAGRIAVSSSFGIESALLLDMVAAIDPGVPVIFADTGLLFPETLAYRDRLVGHLGLSDVRTVTPNPGRLAAEDPKETLHATCSDRCCRLRKVEPFDLALEGFDAWITGRKKYHDADRIALPAVEKDVDGRIKINPLADWNEARVHSAYMLRGLPCHPLAGAGYASIGCAPCTTKCRAGEAVRAGRWAGQERTECGLHLPRMLKGA